MKFPPSHRSVFSEVGRVRRTRRHLDIHRSSSTRQPRRGAFGERALPRTLLLLLILLFPLPVGQAKEISIIILHTTDLHATILPTTDYDGKPDVGGAARCAAMIKKIRAADKNVLLVDAGDLYQGSALGWLTEGSVMTRYVNALQYDAWELGNHEFDWGIEKISARLAETKIPVLAANLHHKPEASTPAAITDAFKKIQPYIIREVEGVKVGIVGIDTPGIPNWSRPRLIPGITLETPVDALKRVIPEMKAAGCKILVLVTHQGIREQGDDHANQLNAVTKAFPELDVVIGGHTHRLHPQQSLNGVLYTQANYWGTYLGRVDLAFDTATNKLVSKKSQAIPMDSSVPMDEELLALLKPQLDDAEKFLATKVGETADIMHARSLAVGTKKETPLFNLLCASIAESIESHGGKVDAVLHGVLSERAVLQPGPITMRDIFEVVPYENTIGVATLTRDQLVEILEENATAWSSDRVRYLWGMTMKLSPSSPAGKRVVFVGDRDGKSLPADGTFRVAFNSYDLASGGTRWKRLREIVDTPEARLKEYDFQTRDALVEYIKKHSPLKAETREWLSIERKPGLKEKPSP